MIANILRPTVVGKGALNAVLDTYGVKGDKTGEAARGKFLADARKAGWQDKDGGLVFPNMVPQVFTAEHPGNRAPDTTGLTVDDVLQFVDNLVTANGAPKVAEWINNGVVLGTKIKLKSKSKDDLGLIEGRFAGSKPTPEQMAAYFAAIAAGKKSEFLRNWDNTAEQPDDAGEQS